MVCRAKMLCLKAFYQELNALSALGYRGKVLSFCLQVHHTLAQCHDNAAVAMHVRLDHVRAVYPPLGISTRLNHECEFSGAA